MNVPISYLITHFYLSQTLKILNYCKFTKLYFQGLNVSGNIDQLTYSNKSLKSISHLPLNKYLITRSFIGTLF